MFIESDREVTPAVLAAMENTGDPRFKEIITALVRHLHAFAREVKLTEPEWERGIGYLVALGQRTNDTHNEAILASDAIGLSTLVCLMNNGQEGNTETAAALLGPFWRMKSPVTVSGGSIVRSPTPGPALFADIQVKDAKGRPIVGVEVDVWQASPVGKYENQDETQADMNLRGKFTTDAQGKFSFRSVKPAGYPVPIDGPVGELLRAQKRHPFRPAHVHFLLFKPGFKTLVTQVFVDDDPKLESDVVFGVTKKLVGDFKKQSGKAPANDVSGEWCSLNYTFFMEPGEAVLPTPPIK
ncbi:MAG: catechol 1,2-dioxygenase [Xanthobacteraceae bacterium]|nr:catechol 1,2-dioxygenase [Xanthobacteraceae bacterium]